MYRRKKGSKESKRNRENYDEEQYVETETRTEKKRRKYVEEMDESPARCE